MKSVPITLFSFAPQVYIESITNTLCKLGYLVKKVKPTDINSVSENIYKGISVFLFGEAIPSQDKLNTLFTQTNSSARFGIFINNDKEINTHLVEQLNEFSAWPCSDNELSLRLQRLGYQYSDKDYNKADKILLDELVNLNIIGQSSALLKTVHNIKKFAPCNAPLLIEGETGTGKELAARAVHYLSDRRNYPFIAINCGALPESLVENELFGHEKGAYTDAGKSSQGLIAQAEGGTLFLDEVEALPHKVQVTLLRFLQENEYRRLGNERVLKANVRVITASNTPIKNLVENGSFREDLYYRLNVMMLLLPPLRARGADVQLIAEHYLSKYREQYNQPEKHLHHSSLIWLNNYRWPGNIRELENMIHRAFVLSDGSEIFLNDIDEYQLGSDYADINVPVIPKEVDFNSAKAQVIKQFEKEYLSRIFKESKGNVTLAAKRAGKERRSLGKLLKKHGIK